MFVSDSIHDDGATEKADEMLIELLQEWQDAGNSPAAMLNAMANLVNDVLESVALPMQ